MKDDTHDSCSKEPIHIPAAIQPYGVLIAVDLNDGKIIFASENISLLIDTPINEILGKTRNDLEALNDQRYLPSTGSSVVSMTEGDGWSTRSFVTADHVEVTEFIPIQFDELSRIGFQARRKIFEEINTSENEQQLLQNLCDSLLPLSGYDRALAYKFDKDFNGSVIAETLSPEMSGSFLNHHFPASDIPEQARALLLRKRVRVIPDTHYDPVTVRSSSNVSNDLDLTDSDLRAVAPVHLMYCQNMGLKATLTIVITHRNKLWGLIGLQSSSAKIITHAMLDLCLDVSLVASNKIESISVREERDAYATILSRQSEFEAIGNATGGQIRKASDIGFILEYFCKVLNCDAFIARIGNQTYALGVDKDDCTNVMGKLSFEDRQVWHSDHIFLKASNGGSLGTSGFCGAITFKDEVLETYIVGLRKEYVFERIWAGHPDEKVKAGPNSSMLGPRKSFATWEETVRGHSKPWSVIDVTLMPTVQAVIRSVHQEIENLDLSLLARQTTNGVVFTDHQGLMTWVNKGFEDLSGYSASELIGRKPGAVLQGKKTNPETVKHIQKCIASLSPFEVDILNYHKNGQDYWVHISCQPVDSNDPKTGFIAIQTDISEQVYAKRKLENLLTRLQVATEATEIGIWEHDLETDYIVWDDPMHQIYGTDPESFPGTYEAWSLRLHDKDRDRVMAEVNTAIDHGLNFHSTFRIVRGENTVRHITSKALVKRDQAGVPVTMIGTNVDITEQVLYNTKLQEAQYNAAAANKAKSIFLASMSHEVRTPLNAIIGFSQILKQEMFGPMANDQYLEYASLIDESGNKLVHLIDDMMNITQIESGNRDYLMEKIDVSVEFANQRKKFTDPPYCLIEPELTFQLNTESAALSYDRRALSQIIDNLVTNAIKFSKEAIHIQVSWTVDENGQGILTFADKGIGIEQGELDKILSPFFQGNSVSVTNPYVANKVEGIGLGLYIVSNILNQTDCSLSVESVLGEGSVFKVIFPANKCLKTII